MASPIFATVGSIIVSFHLSVYFCLFLKCVPTEDICLISSTIWFRLSALLIYNDLVIMHHCTWTCWVVNVQFLLLSPDNSKKLKKPKPWKHNQAITTTQLKQMRDEFWDTAPHYGGQKGTVLSVLYFLLLHVCFKVVEFDIVLLNSACVWLISLKVNAQVVLIFLFRCLSDVCD